MSEVTNWLLQSQPWIKYRTLIDILNRDENDAQVLAARQEMLSDSQVQGLLADLSAWPGPPLKRHNDAGHLLHKLVFVAELGINKGDYGMAQIASNIMQHQSKEGAFSVVANISPHYGGTGEDQQTWMLCDAPSLLYALIKFGFGDDPRVQAAVQHLVNTGMDQGWPCAVSPELGKFRGPGRKTDPCPYATLIALKSLALLSNWRDSQVCRDGAETLLQLWEQRKERRPYLFAMGTDFAKLKAPLIWYDILHVTDVLTRFSWLCNDGRLLEMINIIKVKADNQGLFAAESVWKTWSDWDFGQKKNPSPGMTLFVYRILKRISVDSTSL